MTNCLLLIFFLRVNNRESPKCGRLYGISKGSTIRVDSRFYKEDQPRLTHNVQYMARARCNDSHCEFMIYSIYGFSDQKKDDLSWSLWKLEKMKRMLRKYWKHKENIWSFTCRTMEALYSPSAREEELKSEDMPFSQIVAQIINFWCCT